MWIITEVRPTQVEPWGDNRQIRANCPIGKNKKCTVSVSLFIRRFVGIRSFVTKYFYVSKKTEQFQLFGQDEENYGVAA